VSQRRYKTTVVLVVILAVMAAVTWKVSQREAARRASDAGRPVVSVPYGSGRTSRQTTSSTEQAAGRALPKLIDLGRGTCIPCKAMKPVLEEVAGEYAGRAEVQVIDLTEAPDAARVYGVLVIPTQIFLDDQGKEVLRHVGFMSKEDIVAQFREMGVR